MIDVEGSSRLICVVNYLKCDQLDQSLRSTAVGLLL
jgi:hypothetical protein